MKLLPCGSIEVEKRMEWNFIRGLMQLCRMFHCSLGSTLKVSTYAVLSRTLEVRGVHCYFSRLKSVHLFNGRPQSCLYAISIYVHICVYISVLMKMHKMLSFFLVMREWKALFHSRTLENIRRRICFIDAKVQHFLKDFLRSRSNQARKIPQLHLRQLRNNYYGCLFQKAHIYANCSRKFSITVYCAQKFYTEK